MLKEFRVRNFMNFQDELVFSLADEKRYDFNNHVIKNKIIRDAVLVGDNASGKSNLGKAILDITNHLTDATHTRISDGLYVNLFSKDSEAHFLYTFQFDEHVVSYKYDKLNAETVTREVFTIDGKEIIKNSHNQIFVKLQGAENLNLEKKNMHMSLLKYVYANTVLDMMHVETRVFTEFMEFVQGMLFATSTDVSTYAGFTSVRGNIFNLICKLENGVKELEVFLKDMGILYELVKREDSDGENIYCRFDEKEVPLSRICSSGTRSLIFFYYWYKQNEDIKFLYLDEFDAFYHTKLSREVLMRLIALEDMQVIVSTHNTDTLSNEILRPDCYFELKENEIKPFYKKTSKALREAHNLQKMYKAGAFNE